MRRVPVWMLTLIAAAVSPASAFADSSASQLRTAQAGMIDSGFQHACAVLGTGTAVCWGSDGNGRLGNGAVTGNQGTPTPVALPAGRRAVSISAGWEHTCAVLDDGSAACWGADGSERLGNGAVAGDQQLPSPVALPAGRRAVTISAGWEHSCATLDDGSAVCWGSDASGQLGNGPAVATTQPVPAPVTLPAGRRAVAITAGFFWSCAVLDDGALMCWGEGAYDGLAGSTDQPTPTAVSLPLGRRATAVSGGDFHSCALLDDGAASCWGVDLNGGLGNGAPAGTAFTPSAVLLPTGAHATAVGAGRLHSCVALTNGSMLCWGLDATGQLGNGGGPLADPDQPSPVVVSIPIGRQVLAIAVGGDNSCALLDNGSLWCWGLDTNLQVGDGATAANQFSPVSVLVPLSIPGRIADVSVVVDGAPTALTVLQPGTVAVRLTNSGPDPVSGLAVSLSVVQAGITGLVASQGTATGDLWQVGTLGAGGQALLTVDLMAATPGSASLTAQLMTAGERDPDSTPANSVATEDDQALVTIPVVAAAKTRPDRVTLVLANTRDRSAPHVFRVRGRLVASTIAVAQACRGQVTIAATSGRRVLVRRRVALRIVDGACEYTATLSVSKKVRRTAKTMRITTSFAGNDVLLERTSVTRVARLT